MNDSLFPLSPTEFAVLIEERMPDENSLLTHEDIVLAGVVSKSDSLTLQHHIIFHRQAQFLALVDKIHLDATARREGAGK